MNWFKIQKKDRSFLAVEECGNYVGPDLDVENEAGFASFTIGHLPGRLS